MEKAAIQQTYKEYGRGVIGGLLFSLPLLYTMEVWWTGFIASPEKLLAFVIFSFLLLIGYNQHAGMRKDATNWDIIHESVEEIGLAFITAFLFLLLINKIGFGMSFREIAGKVIVESMMVAIGISVGTAQLGQKKKSDSGKQGSEKSNTKKFLQTIILSICGGVLICSSVAPTQEILVIAVATGPLHLLLMVFFSLLISAVVLFFSDFRGTGSGKKETEEAVAHLVVAYFSSLVVSFILLWLFGRVQGFDLEVIIAQVIILAIPASLGASAGRLLIG